MTLIPERANTGHDRWSSSFERDTVTWSLGKLADRGLSQLFEDEGVMDQYRRWLASEQAQQHATHEPALRLCEVALRVGGCLRFNARATPGEFILVVHHTEFHALVAVSRGALTADPHSIDAVCVADFQGCPHIAIRWAVEAQRLLQAYPLAKVESVGGSLWRPKVIDC